MVLVLVGGFRWFLVVASSVRWSLAVVGRWCQRVVLVIGGGFWVDVTVVLDDDR